MILTKYVTVAGTANVEKTDNILTSTEEEKKKVRKLFVYESTTTRNNDAIIRVYLEREKISEMPVKNFLDFAAAPIYPLAAGEIPLDIEIPVGQTLFVGHVSGATASNMVFTAEYEIV